MRSGVRLTDEAAFGRDTLLSSMVPMGKLPRTLAASCTCDGRWVGEARR